MYGDAKYLTQPKSRAKIYRPAPVLAGILVPSAMFCFVFWCMSFSIRHHRPSFAYAMGPVTSFFVAVFINLAAIRNYKRSMPSTGLINLSVLLWGALIFGTVFGDVNYWQYSNSYFNYMDLLSYPNINPDMDRGQTYMDSGIIYFKEGSTVNTAKAIAFQSTAIYCAAPILMSPLENQDGKAAVELEGPIKPPQSGTVDWWAVGINCCEPSGNNFKCGEVNNPQARSGLRMLRDDARPFFHMAVQEWDSWLGLPSKHPLFFYWVRDPLEQLDGYLINAKNTFFIYAGSFFVFSVLFTYGFLFALTVLSVK